MKLPQSKEEEKSEDTEAKKNGNGNGSNGNGNGNGGSNGALMAEEYQRRGVQSTKSQSIAIIQKDSLSEHTVGVERKRQR